MVVVHPDDVCVVFNGSDNRGELRVHPTITFPILRIEPATGRQAMEQRPENFVRASLIEAGFIEAAQEKWNKRVVFRRPSGTNQIDELLVVIRSGPADPMAAALVQNRCQRADESTVAGFHSETARVCCNRDWQSIGDDNHRAPPYCLATLLTHRSHRP